MQTTLPYTHCALASPLSLFTCLVALPFHSSSSLASPLASPLSLSTLPLSSPSSLASPLSPLFLSALSLHLPLHSPLHSPTSLASPLAPPLSHFTRLSTRLSTRSHSLLPPGTESCPRARTKRASGKTASNRIRRKPIKSKTRLSSKMDEAEEEPCG